MEDPWLELRQQISERQANFVQENKDLEIAYLKGNVRKFVKRQLKRFRQEIGAEEKEAEDAGGETVLGDDHEAFIQQLLDGGWPKRPSEREAPP
jgi:hypothetical protein